jgi:ABC-2 type transport system ATP-binding protein
VSYAFKQTLSSGKWNGTLKFAVEVKGLRKTFVSGWFRKRKTEALKGLDLSVPEGSFWGILGPNGAGKTTLLSILSNLLTPEEGEVKILGEEIRTHGMELCQRINLSSGHANFLWSLSVRENLEYYAMLYGIPARPRRKKIGELLDLFGLTPFSGVRFDELSTGTKQKLSLAKALLNEPELLLLDEPTVGLDPEVARRIRELVQQLHRQKGATILMTTHNMKEAETLCEEVAFIKGGVIQASGRPQDLKRDLRLGDTILISFRSTLPHSLLKSLAGVYGVEASDSTCRILVDNHRERLPQVLDVLMNQKVSIHDLRIQESDLEDVYMAFAK